ncbi:hypothetical protein PHET_11115 [Paragonimus heterotremus]|uniref:Uncharacterized protein n=1 Tax=Paragonimus heterotremus TaxID=100268 RepID=A0A8J4SJK5_9TREM|nr:hypothetical protein PHET_11115 [Paragonimus heterotremus]
MSTQTAYKASYWKPIGWHSAPLSCVRVTFTRGDTHWPGRPEMIAQLCTCLVVVMLTEIDCIVELITRDLDAGLIATSLSTKSSIEQFVINTDLFISNYFGKVQLQIIDWNESAHCSSLRRAIDRTSEDQQTWVPHYLGYRLRADAEKTVTNTSTTGAS